MNLSFFICKLLDGRRDSWSKWMIAEYPSNKTVYGINEAEKFDLTNKFY